MYPPEPSLPEFRWPGRKVWIAIGAAAALIAGGILTWNLVPSDHPAEVVVQDFFAALQDKDFSTAMDAMPSEAAPADESSPLLYDPDSISDGWELTGTEVDEDEKGDRAVVTAEFDVGDETVTAKYDLWSIEDEWWLDQPFVYVTFSLSAAAYGQANDAFVSTVTSDLAIDFPGEALTFALFPGVYEFYQSIPGVVDMEASAPMTLFEPVGEAITVVRPDMALAASAVSSVQEQVDKVIQQCLQFTVYGHGCPFSHLHSEPITVDGVELADFQDIEWSMEAAPEIAVEGIASDSSALGFPIAAAVAEDAVTFTATGEPVEGEGDRVEVSIACDLDFSAWQVTLNTDAEGSEVTVDLQPTGSETGSDFSTCVAD